MTKDFISLIWNFYKENKRDFPWRKTTDPYKIFISEVCLQQTQTSRVIEKYKELLIAFPTVYDLANSSFTEVLSHWSGLGYNRRAKFLLEASKIIVDKYQGVLPTEPDLLDELPGIGFNTAAAIVVYSYNTPIAFIETNIRRVYIHHFFKDKEKVTDTEILEKVNETMDKDNPREWFWALMDYGSFLAKTIPNPNRKSLWYRKQSKFIGSVREVRGSILRILLEANDVSKDHITRRVEGDAQHITDALTQLAAEKLIKQKDGLYSLV